MFLRKRLAQPKETGVPSWDPIAKLAKCKLAKAKLAKAELAKLRQTQSLHKSLQKQSLQN